MFTTSALAARHTQLMSILNVCINVNAYVKCYCSITTMSSTGCNESDKQFKQKFKYLRIVRPRYCADSFSRVRCVPVRRYQQILVKIWIQIRYCPNIRPIPSHVHRPLVPYCLLVATVIDGCSHTCKIRSILRCMHAQSNVLRPHLLSHIWKPFLDNLEKIDATKKKKKMNNLFTTSVCLGMAPWRNLRQTAHSIRQARIVLAAQIKIVCQKHNDVHFRRWENRVDGNCCCCLFVLLCFLMDIPVAVRQKIKFV